MSQYDTPLFTGLLAHAARNPVQFHIPGHKKGAGMAPEFRRYIGDNALAIDLINIAPLDDLHNPHGIIKQAQELAAEAFGADYTFFSVQGTSGAIMAMILSVVGPGETILVPRNVHKSVMSAIVLAGARPVYMAPDVDYNLGIAHGVSVETVVAALDAHPEARAVLVINPTYYGVAADLKSIVEVAHARGVPVLVDEAHGVHIHFHEQMPLSAMQAGADMSATSVHKLGGSLTQSSVLNVREGLVNVGRVQAVLSMLQTTSTSYLLLASLDVARKHLATRGRELIERARQLANYARQEINKIPGLYCFGPEIIGFSSARFDFDPTKLTISVKELGLTGAEVEQILREEFNIEIELSDLYNILCIVSFGDTEDEINILINALRTIAERYYRSRPANQVRVKLPEFPELAMLPRDAFYAPSESVPLLEAEGRIAAEFVIIYPPGIPVLAPGEVITAENIAYIYEHLELGYPVQGPEDPTIQRIRVVANRP
ncbi:MAG: aminotransferase class I/II-fold pyridoxal phosphate-dependent enzyme [Firmicutes bacterium]|nr:aminotransferase class I/II-fold pyridoxal phosphate-dependent enzyme [Bacillota bacterium]